MLVQNVIQLAVSITMALKDRFKITNILNNKGSLFIRFNRDNLVIIYSS